MCTPVGTVPVVPRSTDCAALDAAVARVGDRWTLLVVHALLGGPRRFGELAAALPGLAPNVLTRRLRSLEAEGLLVADAYCRRPPRFAYRLTDAGDDLAGALRLLAQWGVEHPPAGPTAPVAGDDGPDALRHQLCGTPVEARWWCPTCGVGVASDDADDVRYA